MTRFWGHSIAAAALSSTPPAAPPTSTRTAAWRSYYHILHPWKYYIVLQKYLVTWDRSNADTRQDTGPGHLHNITSRYITHGTGLRVMCPAHLVPLLWRAMSEWRLVLVWALLYRWTKPTLSCTILGTDRIPSWSKCCTSRNKQIRRIHNFLSQISRQLTRM